ncbi:hypothetical protein JJB07_03050 [Tumebacillus sp. ITR2]|uniref:Uncharacterized protein n=1 Tax=Tumebacillus amylolyticus TaxID=2801339 RepID=A0ABS1J7I0_9BACL|nr:hypothetical protein [Tumebacillus amylolyticus]MBL0385618.1 hypothetical protein [Tumebacillus amylolyticus]
MKLDEILQRVPWLTKSVFRDLVRKGVLTTSSKGSGKGRGLGSETGTYAENSIEILHSVAQLRDQVRKADLVYAILWEGHEVNYEKLRDRLFDDFHDLNKYLNQMSSLPDDSEAIERAAEYRLPKMKPGKPTQNEVDRREQLMEKEIENLHREFEFVKRIAQRLPIGQYIQMVTNGIEMDGEVTGFFDEWFSKDRWHSVIKATTSDDLRQVHRSILLLKEYMSILMQTNPELYEQFYVVLRLLKKPVFLKIGTFLLLVPAFRGFILGLDDPAKKELWVKTSMEMKDSENLRGGDTL